MMFKRKQQIIESAADRWYIEKWEAIVDAQSRLMKCARDVIIKSGVVNLYPYGIDRSAAKVEEDRAKNALLCAIGHYDGRRQELIDCYKQKAGQLSKCATWKPERWLTSHEYIEMAYVKFFEKR